MTRQILFITAALLSLAACQDYTPREKAARYDPQTGELTYAYPCPDWSKSSVKNYGNANHSNFGCATENNMAAQLDQPSDLYEGHGQAGPDADVTGHVVSLYRDGKIPVQLAPMQDTAGGGGGQ